MAALEKSKKTSKKQKIDRKSNLEQRKNKKTSSIGVRFVKWKTKKEKKSEGPSLLEAGAFEGRRIALSHPIIFPSNRTIEGLPMSTYKKAPATRIGVSGISICIAFR